VDLGLVETDLAIIELFSIPYDIVNFVLTLTRSITIEISKKKKTLFVLSVCCFDPHAPYLFLSWSLFPPNRKEKNTWRRNSWTRGR
jgi:hypothetical protein